MISLRRFIKISMLILGAVIFSSIVPSCSPLSERPNIILIMADDMGYSDLGCYGGEIQTPNLDRMAKNGVRFSQFYNNAKCAPTRASLLTGLYSQQIGMSNGPARMTNCVTIAEVLKMAGYNTYMSGKWHAEELPVDRGFDRYYGLADGCVNHFNPGFCRSGENEPGRKYEGEERKWAIDHQVFKPYTPEDKKFYSTDRFTDYALSYLEESNSSDKPFFLYLAYTAPHYPLHAWPEDIEKYKGKYMEGWDVIRQRRYKRLIESGLITSDCKLTDRDEQVISWGEIENKDEWDLKMSVYAAMIDRMDQNIGRLISKLEADNKLNNTLILFLADNGGCAEDENQTPDIPPGPVESYRTVDPPWANASNTPFRKYKSWNHEGGISTPLIAHWPMVIKQQGSITHQVGHIIDIMSTCIDLADASYPQMYNGKPVIPLEGKSIVPILNGEERDGHDKIFWQYKDKKALRSGDWKIVKNGKQPWELYDMEKDRSETTDFAEEQPERLDKLINGYLSWEKRVIGLGKEMQ